MTTIQKILISRRMLVAEVIPTKSVFKHEGAYLNAFLLANFGIVVDKPELYRSNRKLSRLWIYP